MAQLPQSLRERSKLSADNMSNICICKLAGAAATDGVATPVKLR